MYIHAYIHTTLYNYTSTFYIHYRVDAICVPWYFLPPPLVPLRTGSARALLGVRAFGCPRAQFYTLVQRRECRSSLLTFQPCPLYV